MLEAGARAAFAQTQAQRYEQLLAARSVSTEAAESKRQELQIAQASLAAVRANLDASRQELVRAGADHDALVRQRANLRLIAPVNGLVTRRDADRGTTVVAGQAVVEVVEPASLWINVRFDQQRARGLDARLPAQIVLRSQGGEPLAGRVLRIEPIADAVTEEVLAKVEFNQLPKALPPIGELAEVTVTLAAHAPMPVVPNASVQRVDGRLGVWLVDAGDAALCPGAHRLKRPRRTGAGTGGPGRRRTGGGLQLQGARRQQPHQGGRPDHREEAMISLAGRDIAHAWGKFVLTGIGLGLLIGVTLTMAGVYRGMVDDAKALLDNSGADLWVVQQDTQGPYAESSSLSDDTYRSILGMAGVARAANVTYLTMQVAELGDDKPREVRAMVVGVTPDGAGTSRPAHLPGRWSPAHT